MRFAQVLFDRSRRLHALLAKAFRGELSEPTLLSAGRSN